MKSDELPQALTITGATLAVLTVGTAWAIQKFWPYYSWGVGDFEAWIGRALWFAIGISLLGFLLGTSRVSKNQNIWRGALILAIVIIGLTLDVAPKTKAEGRYYFS